MFGPRCIRLALCIYLLVAREEAGAWVRLWTTTWNVFRPELGNMFGHWWIFRGHVRAILGKLGASVGGDFGVMSGKLSGSCWGNFGIASGANWDHWG